MNEIPVTFGPEGSLVGVLSKPIGPGVIDTACLTFNAGVVPRVGPHRFNVKLARSLAAKGMPNLRFDLSGLGDSRPAKSEQNFNQQAVTDLRAAMDYLELREGIRRFILVGNCSGAVQIYWAALADERVIGILMFDGFAYPTRWSYLAALWKRFRATNWGGLVAAAGRRVLGVAKFFGRNQSPVELAESQPDETSGNPPRQEYCRGIQCLVDRGVSVFHAFSGGAIDYYSYDGQFRDGFADQPFVDKVRCDFLPEIDHTLLSLQAQRKFIAIVQDWALDIVQSRANR